MRRPCTSLGNALSQSDMRGVNPCITRQRSNSARLEHLKYKISNGIVLTWYEKECSNAHCAAVAKGKFCESLAELSRKPNPRVIAEIRQKGKWATKSGVRGNSTPEAMERKTMRTHHKRAKEDFRHIEGCAFDGCAHRFQNSTGRESRA